MHETAMNWFRRYVGPARRPGLALLEIGSRNENGSLRECLTGYDPYVGLDMREGPDVDVVAMAESWRPDREYDVVVSAGTLEHCQNWQGVVETMKNAVKPDGLVAITTVGPGYPRHGYPDDHWRFTPDILNEAFTGFKVLLRGVGWDDVFILAQKYGTPMGRGVPVKMIQALPVDQ